MQLLLIAEDAALAIAVDELTREVLRVEAVARGAHWYLDAVQPFTWVGTRELAEARPGLQYVSTREAESQAPERVEINGRPVQLRGFGSGGAVGPGPHRWRRIAVSAAALVDGTQDALILAVDSDGDAKLAEVVRAGLADTPGPWAVAVPHPEVEAWFVAALPVLEVHHERLADVRHAAGFDPTTAPHRLSSKSGARGAKRVLDTLVTGGQNKGRHVPALDLPPLIHDDGSLPTLAERCAKAGLPEFIAEVRKVLAPLFGFR